MPNLADSIHSNFGVPSPGAVNDKLIAFYKNLYTGIGTPKGVVTPSSTPAWYFDEATGGVSTGFWFNPTGGINDWVVGGVPTGTYVAWLNATNPAYGADPTGATDSTAALNALDAAAGTAVRFLPPGTYKISGAGVTFTGPVQAPGAVLSYTGTGTALTINLPQAGSHWWFTQAFMELPHVLQTAQVWAPGAPGADAGVSVVSAAGAYIHVPSVAGFTDGLFCNPTTAGVLDNHFVLGSLVNNLRSLHLAPAGGTGGYVNSNIFYGGDMHIDSSQGYNIPGSRKILISNGFPNQVFDNLFIKPDIEGPVEEYALECWGTMNRLITPEMELGQSIRTIADLGITNGSPNITCTAGDVAAGLAFNPNTDVGQTLISGGNFPVGTTILSVGVVGPSGYATTAVASQNAIGATGAVSATVSQTKHVVWRHTGGQDQANRNSIEGPVLTGGATGYGTLTVTSDAGAYDNQVRGPVGLSLLWSLFTANFNIQVDDDICIVDTTAGNVTGLLRPAGGCLAGDQVIVAKKDSSAHLVTITPNGTDTIGGVAGSITLISQHDCVTLVGDGVNNWRVISAQIAPVVLTANGQTYTVPITGYYRRVVIAQGGGAGSGGVGVSASGGGGGGGGGASEDHQLLPAGTVLTLALTTTANGGVASNGSAGGNVALTGSGIPSLRATGGTGGAQGSNAGTTVGGGSPASGTSGVIQTSVYGPGWGGQATNTVGRPGGSATQLSGAGGCGGGSANASNGGLSGTPTNDGSSNGNATVGAGGSADVNGQNGRTPTRYGDGGFGGGAASATGASGTGGAGAPGAAYIFFEGV